MTRSGTEVVQKQTGRKIEKCAVQTTRPLLVDSADSASPLLRPCFALLPLTLPSRWPSACLFPSYLVVFPNFWYFLVVIPSRQCSRKCLSSKIGINRRNTPNMLTTSRRAWRSHAGADNTEVGRSGRSSSRSSSRATSQKSILLQFCSLRKWDEALLESARIRFSEVAPKCD